MPYAAAMLAPACGTSPPPVIIEPKPAKTAPMPPKPAEPEPKACKVLDDGCQAEASTKVTIGSSKLAFTPAKGWTYAEGADAALAQAGADGPSLGATVIQNAGSSHDPAKRDAGLSQLAGQLKVSLPKKKVNWKKPDDTKNVAGMKIGLWQVEGAARGTKKGPLLIFSGPTKDGNVVLGLGFVPDDDNSGADASILQSIESLAVSGE